MRAASFLLLSLSLLPPTARADAGAFLGDTSRAAALAGSMTGRVGEPSAIWFNPGALADVQQPTFVVNGHLANMDLRMRRPGERSLQLGRTVSGFGTAIATRLPGPDWLRSVRLGVALHMPTRYAIKVTAPPRVDLPSFPQYGDRAERTGITMVAAAALGERLRLGFGITLTPRLLAPIRAEYFPPRLEGEEGRVDVDIYRELRNEVSFVAGARVAATDALSLGIAVRQRGRIAAQGPNRTRAATILVDDAIDFHDFLSPTEVAAGVALTPSSRLSLSADVVYARWSDYRTIHDLRPEPAFRDVVWLRGGAEWSPRPWLALRAGYGYEPSPVPSQGGETNLLGGHRHVLAAGAGVDLRPLERGAMRLDVHARAFVLQRQRVDKVLGALPDAEPEVPGHQVDNLGYPGFTARGHVLQVGLTATLFLGREPAP